MAYLGPLKAVYAAQLTVDETTATETLGIIGIDPSSGNLYRYVKNASSSAFAQGDFVYYDFSVATNNAAEITVASKLDRLAGLVVNGITNAKHGWIMIEGYADYANIDGTTDVVAGDSLKGQGGNVSLVQDNAAGTEPTYARTAYSLQAVTTNGKNTNQKVFVSCL